MSEKLFIQIGRKINLFSFWTEFNTDAETQKCKIQSAQI